MSEEKNLIYRELKRMGSQQPVSKKKGGGVLGLREYPWKFKDLEVQPKDLKYIERDLLSLGRGLC